MRAPWTAQRSNQSILKEINPECSLEGLMPKLKLQYYGHLMRRTDSLEKTLMLGKIEGKSRRGWKRMRCLAITNLKDMSLNKLGDSEGPGSPGRSSPWGRKGSDTTEQLNTTTCKRRGRQRSAQVRELIVSSYIPGGQVKLGG